MLVCQEGDLEGKKQCQRGDDGRYHDCCFHYPFQCPGRRRDRPALQEYELVQPREQGLPGRTRKGPDLLLEKAEQFSLSRETIMFLCAASLLPSGMVLLNSFLAMIR